MRAINITSPGGPEALALTELPDPVPGPGEVLIEVVAAGVNRADVLQRRGFYEPPQGASPIPGLEVSGRIAGFGPEVSKPFTLGERVVALLSGGGYAAKVAVPAGQVIRIPDGVDLVTAAGLPEVAATVYSNLFMTAGLQAGETLLVHGATGGIGTMAIQLAKAMGVRVIATASSEEKVATATGYLGADAAINYTSQDFSTALPELNNGRGADVILDVVGAKYLSKNIEALNTYGRLVIIGLQGGAKGEIDLGRLMEKRAAIIGTALRPRPEAEKSEIMAAVNEVVWPLIVRGEITPLIARTFPLEQAEAAHRYFDTGQHMGKVLLTL